MKMRRKLIIGISAITMAYCLTVAGKWISEEGLATIGTAFCIVGYIIPILPIYYFYSYLSNKKLACVMVLGWVLLSVSSYWPDYHILKFLGSSVTAITSIAALYVSGGKQYTKE